MIDFTEIDLKAVQSIEPGRPLDCLIFTKVMGKTCRRFRPEDDDAGDLAGWYEYPQTTMLPEPVPRYSTDIAAAFMVLEKLRERFSNVGLFADNGWGLTVWTIDGKGMGRRTTGPFNAESAPLAICRTALAVVMK